MCRIAGYLGTPIPISSLLSESTHSLKQQARAPRELPAGMLGSDGYGFAWTPADSSRSARYRQILPIWSDANLDTLAPFITAGCIVAATRTAQDDMPVSLTNTPPFCFGPLMVAHNGSVHRFSETLAEPLRAKLHDEARRALQGNTDSEHIAALLSDGRGKSLEKTVRSTLSMLRELISQTRTKAQLNLVVANGHELVATRFAVDQDAPSLYFMHSATGVCIASEPLNEDQTWTRVPEDGLVVATLGPAGKLSVQQHQLPGV